MPEKVRRRKRSESFLGVHFDFHANDKCSDIGSETTPELIEYIIDKVKPDYIQCDCKGHRGLCSYPTQVGNRAPCIIGDPLKIWREVTKQRGVSLYMHYSGVWDTEMNRKHPEWGRLDSEGKTDDRMMSVFGPYVDELLLPQLKELSDVYEVDGVWIDGDCWATGHDYGKEVIEQFQKQTGITQVPKTPEDPYFREFTEFCRDGFRKYLKYYVNEMHKHNPDFEIASNWAYSSLMPEPPEADVDFISGDYTLQDSVNSARIQGRCLVYQGKPWDLMAWGFSSSRNEGGRTTKSATQLKQEAAIVISLGGGFQCYFRQKENGSISKWEMDVMGEVAKFCRERESLCHKAKPIPQIGLLYASKSFYRNSARLFNGALHEELLPLKGVLNNLLASQNVVDVVMEHHLKGRMNEYPLIVIPEWDYLEPSFREDILQYVSDGGNLLLIGPKTLSLFEKECDVELVGDISEGVTHWLEWNGALAGTRAAFCPVKLGSKAIPFGRLFSTNDLEGKSEVAASITPYGKGKIAATFINMGVRYYNASTPVARQFLNGLVRELFPDPIVEVKGSQYVDVTLNSIRDSLVVNLVNVSGPHADPKIHVFDEIPPLYDLHISIKRDKRPNSVRLEPAGVELDYQYVSGKIKLVLPKLEIHSCVVVK